MVATAAVRGPALSTVKRRCEGVGTDFRGKRNTASRSKASTVQTPRVMPLKPDSPDKPPKPPAATVGAATTITAA